MLPAVTLSGTLYIATALLLLRFLIQRVLAAHFTIAELRPQHRGKSLEYSYFYHLPIVVLILSEVQWNMFDLAVWALSYVGVGMVRGAIHAVRVEREALLNDYSYQQRVMVLLQASRVYGVLLFVASLCYFVLVQQTFVGVSLRVSGLLLFPTMMLAVDSLFLWLSSSASEADMLSYFNPNINQISPTHRLELFEKMAANSIRVWHYYNLVRLFVKAALQKVGIFDCLWVLSVLNACLLSAVALYRAISKYRSFTQLVAHFNRIFQPTATAPDQTCVICMTELLNCRRLNTCGHLFHYKCLFQWIQTKNECPVCRAPIQLSQQ